MNRPRRSLRRSARIALTISTLIASAAWLGPRLHSPAVAGVEAMPAQAMVINRATTTAQPSTGETRQSRLALHVVPSTARQPSQTDPLPALDLPLADIIDELQHRAGRGDTRAACRLGHELARCNDPFLAARASQSDAHIIERYARRSAADPQEASEASGDLARRDEAAATLQQCARVERALIRRAPYFLLQAAQAGHVPSMLAFVHRSQLNSASDMVYDPGLAQLYHDHLGPVFVRALQAGDPIAAQLWNMALWPHSMSPLRDVLPEPLRDSQVAEEVMQRVARLLGEPDARPTDSPSEPLSSAQQQLAEQLFADYFENSAWLQQRVAEDAQDPAIRQAGAERERHLLRSCEADW